MPEHHTDGTDEGCSQQTDTRSADARRAADRPRETRAGPPRPLPDGGEADGADDGSTGGSTPGIEEEVIYETTPTIKPTLLLMGLVFLLGVVVEAVLLTNPDAVGGQDVAEILVYVVAFLIVVAMVRFLVRMLVLERTSYQVTDKVVRREFRLLFRQVEREVPLEHLRAQELQRNRIQALLGYGTVRFLTGGTNESLGFVAFENLIDPEETRDVIRTVLL